MAGDNMSYTKIQKHAGIMPTKSLINGVDCMNPIFLGQIN